MTFFSESLIDDQFVQSLRTDLDRADVCRFLVAYISTKGIEQIGVNRLCDALENELSFGVGSISCVCGFKPLMDLQQNISTDPARLKYFMDPAIRKSDEPDDIALMHSKVIYMRAIIDNEPKSIVYVGSHNWSTRALGGSGPRNAEASYRFEFPFKVEHLGLNPAKSFCVIAICIVKHGVFRHFGHLASSLEIAVSENLQNRKDAVIYGVFLHSIKKPRLIEA